MKFVIRVDDIGWSPKAVDKIDRELRLARRFHEAMRGAPYVAAVIPSMLDAAGLAWLQSAPAGMTIALHGLDHAPVEFRGLTGEQMRQRIQLSQERMAGITIADMVLPFNQYESGLECACRLQGIERLWGGGHHQHTDPSRWPTPPAPYPVGPILFMPSWKPAYAATLWRMSDECPALCDTLPQLLQSPGKCILTLHITWESGLCDHFEGVRHLIKTIGDEIIGVGGYLE